MTECSFCKIITGKLPSNKIYGNEYVLAFAPLKDQIIAKGHMLVIPRKHYVNFYDIPKAELHHIVDAIKTISQRLKEKYGAEGINILHASGKVAQQSCFHFHIHLIPRYNDDGLDTWPKTGYKEANFPEVYKEIANFFASPRTSANRDVTSPVPVWTISIQKKNTEKGYFESIGRRGDKIIHEQFLGKMILLRCISSKDHKKKVDEVVNIIKRTGTDRYDSKIKMIFHEFYEKHKPDLFLDECLVTKEKSIMKNILQDFYQKTQGDRKRGIYANIVTIYSPRKMKMIKNVYEGQEKSDCFQFRDQKNKQKALLGIIVIKS